MERLNRNGHIFEIPIGELYCEDCETMNFFYSDNEPPYLCDNCGKEIKVLKEGDKLIKSPSATVHCNNCGSTTKVYKADPPPYLCGGCGREFYPDH